MAADSGGHLANKRNVPDIEYMHKFKQFQATLINSLFKQIKAKVLGAAHVKM